MVTRQPACASVVAAAGGGLYWIAVGILGAFLGAHALDPAAVIDPDLADTATLSAAYDLPMESGGNCVVVMGRAWRRSATSLAICGASVSPTRPQCSPASPSPSASCR